MTSDTLDIGMTATLAAEGVAASPGFITLNTALRTTVLPRVEVIGEQPHIVADGKVRYELGRQLGEGGVGEVLKARDNDIDRDVAVKRLRAEMKGSHTTVLRFAEEVRTVGRLEHPNIVPIHDVGVHEDGDYFFVMKYVEGDTLEAIIEKLSSGDPEYTAKYPTERRVEIFMGILEAIAYAHSKRIIHRDIKPGNVMVGPYGEVIVMDWGLARDIAGPAPLVSARPNETPSSRKLTTTHHGAVVGTPAYMSPEQARGDALDERSDVYSLCVLFYELLALRHPHEGEQTLESMIDAVKNKPAPMAVMAGVPADLSWFLVKGLHKDKSARYQSVQEMIDRLRRRSDGDIPIQCPITFSMRMTTLVRGGLAKRPFLMSAAFILGSLAMIGLACAGAVDMAHHI